jgi:hypothetical protein
MGLLLPESVGRLVYRIEGKIIGGFSERNLPLPQIPYKSVLRLNSGLRYREKPVPNRLKMLAISKKGILRQTLRSKSMMRGNLRCYTRKGFVIYVRYLILTAETRWVGHAAGIKDARNLWL